MLFAALRHVPRLAISLHPLLIPIIVIWLFSIIVITNVGYCFEPHLPQNFAVGFSGFPQLLQDEDVCLVSAGFGLGL
jgi:hypothetical protein